MFSIFVLESEKIHHNSVVKPERNYRAEERSLPQQISYKHQIFRGVFLNKSVANIKYLVAANKSQLDRSLKNTGI